MVKNKIISNIFHTIAYLLTYNAFSIKPLPGSRNPSNNHVHNARVRFCLLFFLSPSHLYSNIKYKAQTALIQT